jgi:putative transcriptional regulator
MTKLGAPDIRQLREALGLTQEEFARELGVSFSTVSRWETGRGRPSHLAIHRIEEARERLRSRDESGKGTPGEDS